MSQSLLMRILRDLGIIASLLLLLTVGWIVYQWRMSPDMGAATTDPNIAFNTNDFDAALASLDARLSANPNNAGLMVQKALTLAQRGSIEFKEKEYAAQAIQLAEQALAIDPQNSNAWRAIGYAHEITQEYDAAHEAYAKSLALDSNNALTLSQEAHAYDLEGKADKAAEEYRQALAILPTLDQALMGLGRISSQTDPKVALTYFLSAATSTPNVRLQAEALYSAGVIKSTQNDREAAASLFQQAIKADPTYAQGYVGRAAQLFVKAIDPNGPNDQDKRLSYMRDSLDALQKAISLNPNLTTALYQLGVELVMAGQKDKAMTVFDQALKAVETDITLSETDRIIVRDRIQATIDNAKRIQYPPHETSSLPSPVTQVAAQYCFADTSCINFDTVGTWFWGYGGGIGSYASGQAFLADMLQWDTALSAQYGHGVYATYDGSGMISTIACTNGNVNAAYSPPTYSQGGYYGQAGYYSQASYCPETYTCTNNTITHTSANCTKTTTATCNANQYCSNGSSACFKLIVLKPKSFDQSEFATLYGSGSNGADKYTNNARLMSGALTAIPTLVKSGDTTKVFWNSQNAESCTVTQSGKTISTALTSTAAGIVSTPITHQTVFHMHCKGIPDTKPAEIDDEVIVNIIPVFEEQ